jgi:maspardin
MPRMDKLVERLQELERRVPLDRLEIGGHRWEWIDTGGRGPCIVTLPGSAADAFMFARPLLELGETHRVVSVTPPPLWQPDQLADGLAALMIHLQLPPAVVVGSSFGAYWGAFVAQRHSDLVRALLVGNGFVEAIDLQGNPLFEREFIEDQTPHSLHAQFLARVEASPPSPLRELQLFMLSRKDPDALHAHFLAVVRAKACPPLSLDPARILVLDCEDDPVIPAAGREHVRRHFAPARSVTLASGGHYAHILNWREYEPALRSLLD